MVACIQIMFTTCNHKRPTMFQNDQSINQTVWLDFPNNITVSIKREDLLHPEISGNKFRKLKYNIAKAQEQGYSQLLTFGGAYSNHIAATAAAGRIFGIKTIGIIRGDELSQTYQNNPTLAKAEQDGMVFQFISRQAYRRKTCPDFLQALQQEFGHVYIVPEGGTNAEAIQGTAEILTETDQNFDYIAVAVGTGGTIAGIINSANPDQMVLGFPALKGEFLGAQIRQWTHQPNWTLIHDYHFGGYAKYNDNLLSFIASFQDKTGIALDPIYTGKMVYGICDLIDKNHFPAGSKILLIHTGGLQGWNDTITTKS